MNKITANFTNQLRDAIQIGKNTSFKITNKTISSVLICGLGGSGIGGKIIDLLLKLDIKIPVIVTNDYSIPSFVNETTLVIASSYSGNTEETLAAVIESSKRNSELVAITSGGKLLDLVKANNWNSLVVPGGEQPRGMLAYSLVQLLYIFEKYNLVDPNYTPLLNEVIELVDTNETNIQTEAKALAANIHNKQVVIYAEQSLEGVAVRFRQQINENAKELCWHHVLPEMNHNELVGWAGGSKNQAIIKLNSSLDFYRTKKRWEICKEVISKYTDSIYEIEAKGSAKLVQILYLIHLTDWVSIFLADLKNVDSLEVEVILHLKSELGKLK
jgi:glucose/mannose-6-phosphate isomerase